VPFLSAPNGTLHRAFSFVRTLVEYPQRQTSLLVSPPRIMLFDMSWREEIPSAPAATLSQPALQARRPLTICLSRSECLCSERSPKLPYKISGPCPGHLPLRYLV